MYELIIPNYVKKDIKKLDKSVIKKVIDIFEEISENPFIGIQLKGELSHLLKSDFRQQGVSYRIVYEIIQEHVHVKIVHVGTRENFYNELKRRR